MIKETGNKSANVDPLELEKFSQLAHRWWDPNSEFKPLHEINPLRLDYIDRHTGLADQPRRVLRAVTRPVVDLSTEMTNMLVASRLYQANLSVMSSAREAYQAALSIGKGA